MLKAFSSSRNRYFIYFYYFALIISFFCFSHVKLSLGEIIDKVGQINDNSGEASPVRIGFNIIDHKDSNDLKFIMKLNMLIENGWVVYTNNPGDIGLPLSIKLNQANSVNIKNINIKYPNTFIVKKEDIDQEVIVSNVYEKEADIDIEIYPQNLEEKFKLVLDLDYSACGDSCMLFNKSISYDSGLNEDIKEIEVEKKQSWSLIILMAIAGGLILNFMPCVLPVISIKLLHFVKYSGLNRIDLSINLILISLGVLVSFWVLCIFTLLLKTAGNTIGWGIHFQEPRFIMLLIIVIWMLILNLLGYINFSFQFSAKLSNLNIKSVYLNSFMSGMLLTLLATPCTAPFLTTAVTFALSQNNISIFIIYSLIALGMSAPYLLIAFKPKLLNILPKPGKWMIYFKKFLALPLFATIMWLAYVLSQQLLLNSLSIFFSFIILLTIISFMGYNIANIKMMFKKYAYKRLVSRLLKLAVMLSFIGCIMLINHDSSQGNHIAAFKGNWINFDRGKLENYITNKELVLVNVTADWCITCKVNEALVLKRQDIINTLHELGVVLVKADYTNRSSEVSNYLSENKRFGIPFNVVYGPNASNGIILPEILDKKELLNALKNAKR